MDQDTVKIRCPKCHDKTHNWKDVYQSNGSVLTKVEASYITWCQSNNEYLLSNEKDINVAPEINQELTQICNLQNN